MVCRLFLLFSDVSKIPFGLGFSPCFFLNQGLRSPQISFWRTRLLLGIPVNSLEHSNDSCSLLALLLRDSETTPFRVFSVGIYLLQSWDSFLPELSPSLSLSCFCPMGSPGRAF